MLHNWIVTQCAGQPWSPEGALTDYHTAEMPTGDLFLAFVFVLVRLSTFEATSASALQLAEQPYAVAPLADRQTLHDGSVEDHHLDDPPSQTQHRSSGGDARLLPGPLRPTSTNRNGADAPCLCSVCAASAFPAADPAAAPAAKFCWLITASESAAIRCTDGSCGLSHAVRSTSYLTRRAAIGTPRWSPPRLQLRRKTMNQTSPPMT
jgi:hypothetical protein